jgi:hypothetical protein
VFIICFCQITFAQKKIPTLYENDPNALKIDVKDAYKHIGKVIIVHDSIYSAKIYQDSIAVCQVGKKTNPAYQLFSLFEDF